MLAASENRAGKQMFKLDASGRGTYAIRDAITPPDAVGDAGLAGRSYTLQSLFQEIVECPQCDGAQWQNNNQGMVCKRCGYNSRVAGRHIYLLPEKLSGNNAGESAAYDTEDQEAAKHLFEYSMKKPYNYPAVVRDAYLRCAELMTKAAADLGPRPSVLFAFGGGGMEPHLCGLLGPNVVISDISRSMLSLAEQRYDYHNVAQPAAFVTCDAERLPFKSGSFDLVIAFEGIHHCMVPQAALNEVWRVARRRTLVVDNYECLLTSILFALGKSSRIETSGVQPGRFTKTMINTMLHNARLEHSWFQFRSAIPFGLSVRLGKHGTRFIERLLETVHQANMFILATDTKGPIDLS